jgi:predicted HTH transcriptional regulator
LRTFGFNVNNELFEQHSWYFRNALVRANYKNYKKGVYTTNEFLLRFFENLLLGEKHTLKNRVMHIHYSDTVKLPNDTVKPQNDTVNDTVFTLIKENNKITATEIGERLQISVSTVKRKIKGLKASNKLERIGSDKTGYWKITE